MSKTSQLQEYLAHFQSRRVTPELQAEVGNAISEWMKANAITHPSQTGEKFTLTFACGNSVEMNWEFRPSDGSAAVPIEGSTH